MKKQRQERILEIVSNFDVQTQDEITEILKNEGFKVTQATVSRDLRDLKLTKNMSAMGVYRYTVGRAHEHIGMVKLNHAMVESITSVKYSMNTVVIKTFPGLAQAVASGVDALNLDSVLGCVAGDDTIIVVTIDVESSAEFSEKIKELMKTY
ncbi:MAG: arginine repressor [Ruminococcaceae bacterium]|nr:arginine repressor [Oscillospiraceae bacterium]